MTAKPDIFKVCIDRCPEAYGNETVHSQVMEKLKNRPNTTVEEIGCLGICSLIGRPAGGIGNFIEQTGCQNRQGLFAFTSEETVMRVYLDDINKKT